MPSVFAFSFVMIHGNHGNLVPPFRQIFATSSRAVAPAPAAGQKWIVGRISSYGPFRQRAMKEFDAAFSR